MKTWTWFAVLGLIIFGQGCGKSSSSDSGASMGFPSGSTMKPVNGIARFGNQCPYGSVIPPQPVPLELWECPLNVRTVQLADPLQSFILQADCKKKTLDVRSDNRNVAPSSWEIMPDGNFYLSLNAGVAKLKDDGSGNQNCTTPLQAELWGRVDCKDRDKAIIRVETVWWLGKTLPTPTPQPSSSPSPGSRGSGRPSAAAPTPSANPSGSPVPRPAPVSNAEPSCKIPTGCYFHNITRIDQCS